MKVLCKLHKTSLKNPTNRNKEKYRAKHAEYKKHCDKAKKISWADYKEKINSVEAANTFRKIIESSTRHSLGTLEKTDGTITEPGTETLEYLLTQHFPSSTPVKPTEYSSRSITREEINAFQPDWVTPEKVKQAFHGFQGKKIPRDRRTKTYYSKTPTPRHNKLHYLTLQGTFTTRIYSHKMEGM